MLEVRKFTFNSSEVLEMERETLKKGVVVGGHRYGRVCAVLCASIQGEVKGGVEGEGKERESEREKERRGE